MDSKLKFTDVPEESNFYDLIAGDNVLEIPLFQRPYMWKQKHLKAFWEDVERLDDVDDAAVFLGIIVSFSRGSGPGRPPTWMIVDGQQRVSTLYLTILSSIEVAASAGELDWAADILGRYMLVRPMAGISVNTKLVPSFNDRAQFHGIWQKILNIKNFQTHKIIASNLPLPPSPTGQEGGAMLQQYGRARSYLQKGFKEHGLDWLTKRIEQVTRNLSMVSIALRDPTVAPKIFERLNYGAEPVTVADLVRNEVFAQSSDDAERARNLFENRWEPFVARFEDKNADLDRFLFPYGLLDDPNIKKAELFPALRKRWSGAQSPRDIIDDLEKFQPAYLSLTRDIPYPHGSDVLQGRINRIFRSGRPSSIYPFLLNLLRSFEKNVVTEATAISALDTVESFLVRRAILGIEPTGLHAAFKGLWQELTDDSEQSIILDDLVTPQRIKEAIKKKATVSWPSDAEFIQACQVGELYRRKIAKYAIREYESSLKGETPTDDHQIEHIAPQSPTSDWKEIIPTEYEKLVHTWGNLLPLTPVMNPAAGNSNFSKKRDGYSNSIFASAREVAKLDVWDADAIRARSKIISDWAMIRWPH